MALAASWHASTTHKHAENTHDIEKLRVSWVGKDGGEIDEEFTPIGGRDDVIGYLAGGRFLLLEVSRQHLDEEDRVGGHVPRSMEHETQL